MTTEVPTGVPVVISPRGRAGLSYREALQSPCLSCSDSPCCTHLMLQGIEFRTLAEVDHAIYLLNFEGVILEMSRPGAQALVYFQQSCRYLDSASGLCTVHGTSDQPWICVHYNAYSCDYRRDMVGEGRPDVPHVDRRRMAWYAEQLIFDEDRRVVGRPEWDEVVEAFASMPIERHTAPPPAPDPMIEEWRSIVLSAKPSTDRPLSPHRYNDPVVSDPCQPCEAYCCKTLVFSRPPPADTSKLDEFRYCLGFPGVELAVSDDEWAVVVRTTCRHLDGSQCSVFGTDERPLQCSYYEALKCTYRPHFGRPRPDDMVRISRQQFGVLADAVYFDDAGKLSATPSVEVLRQLLEDAERVAAGQLTS